MSVTACRAGSRKQVGRLPGREAHALCRRLTRLDGGHRNIDTRNQLATSMSLATATQGPQHPEDTQGPQHPDDTRLQAQAGNGLEDGSEHGQPVDGGQRDAVPLQGARKAAVHSWSHCDWCAAKHCFRCGAQQPAVLRRLPGSSLGMAAGPRVLTATGSGAPASN
jgi:hypothetical protein